MADAAIVILAGTDGHENVGRLVNGLQTAAEFAETEGDAVELVFDGAGTEWIPELEDEDHDTHELYRSLKQHASVCAFCAGAFGVEESVDDAGLETLDDHEGHPSVRSLVADGYEILTY